LPLRPGKPHTFLKQGEKRKASIEADLVHKLVIQVTPTTAPAPSTGFYEAVISAIQKEGFLSEDDVFDECDIIKKRTPILEWHTWALQSRICARFFSGGTSSSIAGRRQDEQGWHGRT
jgi:hypothetical protein